MIYYCLMTFNISLLKIIKDLNLEMSCNCCPVIFVDSVSITASHSFFFFFFLLFFILVISCINWRNFNFFCCNKPMRRLFIVILKFPDLMLILLGTILFRLWLFFVVSPLGDCSLVGRTLGLQFVLAGLVSRLPKCRV